MSDAIEPINALVLEQAEKNFLACGGASRWARAMVARRPFRDTDEMIAVADEFWRELGPEDWLEAFGRHPRIGQKLDAPKAAADTQESGVSRNWSAQEQSSVSRGSVDVVTRLAEANREYWERFGFIFIVCATGKTAEQMLAILEGRIQNDRAHELEVAAEELRQIMQIRLEKLLAAHSL
jgi:OHCU decarboxylase